MPRSKNPDNYPPELRALLEATTHAEQAIRIPMEDLAAAERVRNQLYAYIIAVDTREQASEQPWEMCNAPKWRQVKITSEVQADDSAVLVLTRKSNTSEMQAIGLALAGLTATPSKPAEQVRGAPAVSTARPEPAKALEFELVEPAPTLDLDAMFEKEYR